MTQSYRRKPATAKRVLSQAFDLVGATALGGLNALGKFVKRLGVDRELRQRFRDVKAPWAVWRLDCTLRSLLDARSAWRGAPRPLRGLGERSRRRAPNWASSGCASVEERLPRLPGFEDPELLGSLHGLLRGVVTQALQGRKAVVLATVSEPPNPAS